MTVHVTVGGGPAPNPAIAGADFEPIGSFAIVIPDGAESGTGTFTFTPIEDEEVEEDEVRLHHGRFRYAFRCGVGRRACHHGQR